MSRLDYSKWDHIEISDDEDDTHPNVDTPSLFRWRHQARLDRMKEREQEWSEVKQGKEENEKVMKQIQSKLKSQKLSDSEITKLNASKEELKKQEEEFKKKEKELEKKDKETPWNVDTLSKDGFDKTILNKSTKEAKKDLTDEEFIDEQRKYEEKYRKELKHYGMLSKPEDSKKYLQSHPHLVCDKAANFLVVWCVDLEVAEKHSLVKIVTHQTLAMNYILTLAKSLKADPRDCFVKFFTNIENMNDTYRKDFQKELEDLRIRVKERAQARIDDALAKYEEEERQKQMGPGGLHPGDVMETLPEAMRECFEKRDIGMLQKVVSEMDQKEAAYHIDRCVKSGLWLPEGGKGSPAEEEEEVYAEATEVTKDQSQSASS